VADAEPAIRLSIIVATTGRPTLAAALASATGQMRPGDELILVFDDSGDAGDTPRNRVLDSASGTHIMFLDDDDELRPHALATVRRFAAAHPGRIGMFRLDLGMWGIAPVVKDLLSSATAMYVIPNVKGKIGRFGRVPGAKEGRLGDYKFIVETVALQGDPVFCDEVIQDIRPERRRLKRLRYRLSLRRRLQRALGMHAPDPVPSRPSYPDAERWAEEMLRSAGRQVPPSAAKASARTSCVCPR
jgi:glycosyltransferase involved in cell wall biosynthesis